MGPGWAGWARAGRCCCCSAGRRAELPLPSLVPFLTSARWPKALVSALVAERTLLVDAAAPFSFVLGEFVPLVRVDSCPGERVGHDGSY